MKMAQLICLALILCITIAMAIPQEPVATMYEKPNCTGSNTPGIVVSQRKTEWQATWPMRSNMMSVMIDNPANCKSLHSNKLMLWSADSADNLIQVGNCITKGTTIVASGKVADWNDRAPSILPAFATDFLENVFRLSNNAALVWKDCSPQEEKQGEEIVDAQARQNRLRKRRFG